MLLEIVRYHSDYTNAAEIFCDIESDSMLEFWMCRRRPEHRRRRFAGVLDIKRQDVLCTPRQQEEISAFGICSGTNERAGQARAPSLIQGTPNWSDVVLPRRIRV